MREEKLKKGKKVCYVCLAGGVAVLLETSDKHKRGFPKNIVYSLILIQLKTDHVCGQGVAHRGGKRPLGGRASAWHLDSAPDSADNIGSVERIAPV